MRALLSRSILRFKIWTHKDGQRTTYNNIENNHIYYPLYIQIYSISIRCKPQIWAVLHQLVSWEYHPYPEPSLRALTWRALPERKWSHTHLGFLKFSPLKKAYWKCLWYLWFSMYQSHVSVIYIHHYISVLSLQVVRLKMPRPPPRHRPPLPHQSGASANI